jgi:hypothetical protein
MLWRDMMNPEVMIMKQGKQNIDSLDVDVIHERVVILKDSLMFLADAQTDLFIDYFKASLELAASYCEKIADDLRELIDEAKRA